MSATLTVPVVSTNGVPSSDELYEVVDGEYRRIEPMGATAGTVTTILCHFLAAYALPIRLGLPMVEVLFQLSAVGPLRRRPDLAFVKADRLAGLIDLDVDPEAYAIVPNLAVEAVSPTNLATELEDKIDDYFTAGVQLVWVIYPRKRRIHVYDSPTSARILTEADELVGDPAVPGFRLRIADLFAAVTQTA